MRLPVTWKGCGRPSARSAIASPSITSAERQRPRPLHDLRHPRGHVLQVPREHAHLVARLVHLDAGPVDLVLDSGRTRALERLGRRSARSGPASAGPVVRPRAGTVAAQGFRRLRARGPPAPPGPGEPRSMTARRTSTSGSSAARASASTTSDSSAPCRRSPRASPDEEAPAPQRLRRRTSASSLPAASAAEPAPATAAMASNAASTSRTVRVGSRRRQPAGRAAWPSRHRCAAASARPTETRPSRGLRRARQRAAPRAISSTLRRREDVDASSADVAARVGEQHAVSPVPRGRLGVDPADGPPRHDLGELRTTALLGSPGRRPGAPARGRAAPRPRPVSTSLHIHSGVTGQVDAAALVELGVGQAGAQGEDRDTRATQVLGDALA